MTHYPYSERARRAMNSRSHRSLEKMQEDRKNKEKQTSWPTLPCCDAMRAGLQCDCCEVVDA